MMSTRIPPDYRVILHLVHEGASVLDLGCGEGDLLALLIKNRKVKGQGIEIDNQQIYKCVERGLSVFQGDIDSGLAEFGDNQFDYVILNNCLQELKWPDAALNDAMRVAREVIVGFPNFATLGARLQLLFTGKTPVTPSLPYKWYETPNLHFLSILDFEEYCDLKEMNVKHRVFLNGNNRIRFLPNLLANQAIFVLCQTD